ncbi:ABC transporter ATP-binding protein [Lactobacillus sp. LC28-10]|uniref:ABC transporter ATP-binding protein n=1 Tax=Secundilactobacillus angelensis TaxID=2722706 RepID=A0ABX1KZ49_9LACO|nr:ABC transporter ATP-binding protein [Secundilactobacillus angelensis]MCH5462084.1 ABC transporter ATP-binding protein [Secundilactobacillus angelensis]NLR18435.1 ABC transporter ATP-binding protein [Secundilactobacillus angelensis]
MAKLKPIKINHVSKYFGKQQVLDDIELTIEPETIYGLLGRNGAGKSTLFNIITDRIPLSDGEVTIAGQPVTDNDAVLNRIYLMSEANLYPSRMRVKDIFQLTAQLYQGMDMALAQTLAEQFELNMSTRFNKLSTGSRSIMKLIIALAVDVDYVFLDEPTLGLDANHRRLFYDALLDSYAKRPRSFIISTHLIEEASNLIERVWVLQNQHIIIDESTESVLNKGFAVTGPTADVEAYTAGLNIIGHEALGNLMVHYIYGELKGDRPIPDTVSISHIDLQRLFIYLTNQEVSTDEN